MNDAQAPPPHRDRRLNSTDIDNIAVAHLAIAMTVCIGVFRRKEGRSAEWRDLDDMVLVETKPLSAHRKFLKPLLPEQLSHHQLPAKA